MSNITPLHPVTPLSQAEWHREQRDIAAQMDWEIKVELEKCMKNPITVKSKMKAAMEAIGEEVAARIATFNAEWYLKKDSLPLNHINKKRIMLMTIGMMLVEQLEKEMVEDIEADLFK